MGLSLWFVSIFCIIDINGFNFSIQIPVGDMRVVYMSIEIKSVRYYITHLPDAYLMLT